MFIRVAYENAQRGGIIHGENPKQKGNIKMKKIFAIVLAALMLFALVACNEQPKTPVTDAPQGGTTEAPVADSALEILEKVWASFADEEKFMAAGGFGDTMNWEGAGSIPTDNEEALMTAQAYFVMDADAVAMVDEIAHLMHGMNANTFTAGVFHLKNAADKDAFIASVKASVMGNHWMCGSPEKFVVITVGDYVITAFGHAGVTEFSANTVPPFVDSVKANYPTATVVVEESIGA